MVAIDKKTLPSPPKQRPTTTTTSNNNNNNKSTTTKDKLLPFGFDALFISKTFYDTLSYDFHAFHKHDGNCAAHLITTTLGVWGAIQFVVLVLPNLLLLQQQLSNDNNIGLYVVYGYMAWIALTTPIFTTTALWHTALVYGMLQVSPQTLCTYLLQIPLDDEEQEITFLLPFLESLSTSFTLETWHICVLAMVIGYGLQDLAHYLACEPTFMSHYLKQGRPWMLIVHSIYLLPLVLDSCITKRKFFLSHLVSRNRVVSCNVSCRNDVDGLRNWIHQNVPVTAETTHVWPHRGSSSETTSKHVLAMENDDNIRAAFRTVFPKHHYDFLVAQEMNEIYITAVGAKSSINSDAVFYTPHTDGPYWWLPYASLYRVLVGVTPNQMVRTRFNLQHESQDKVLDMYNVVGFDYNRELHWIDHVPHTKNEERRSLVKLHYVVYPKGWHKYGKFCMYLNTSYNTWARNNFLKTLRPTNMYEYVMAWWIWSTTWMNALFEEYIGWSNLVYILVTRFALPGQQYTFFLATSFRHYLLYMTTFAFRQPMVAHGYLMRDAKLYKTIAMMHLAHQLMPLIQLPRDIPVLMAALCGFSITLLATAQLGMVRTYFGTELGFVPAKWVSGFPYNVIPHPMISGQLVAFGSILAWYWNEMSNFQAGLLMGHMGCYVTHMVQEILCSSY